MNKDNGRGVGKQGGVSNHNSAYLGLILCNNSRLDVPCLLCHSCGVNSAVAGAPLAPPPSDATKPKAPSGPDLRVPGPPSTSLGATPQLASGPAKAANKAAGKVVLATCMHLQLLVLSCVEWVCMDLEMKRALSDGPHFVPRTVNIPTCIHKTCTHACLHAYIHSSSCKQGGKAYCICST